MNRLRTSIALVTSTALTLALTGCIAGPGAAGIASAPLKPAQNAGGLNGVLHGGQSPVNQSKVYLYAVNATAYGNASQSLLTTNGGYVLTDTNGNFSITGDYNCPSSTSLVYLLAVGGDAGSGQNASLAMMAAIGNCAALKANAANMFVTVNEVTTVSAVYALAPFMVSSTAVGAPASNLAGITSAFAEANNLVSNAYGLSNVTTPAGNGKVPNQLINSLADAIAVCVNSNGAVTGGTSTPCDQIFSPTTVSGVVPTDTVLAVLSMAKHPANNAGTIASVAVPASPFQPTLGTTPTDLTISVAYAGGGIKTPQGVAIDANGNAWVANTNNTVTELGAATGAFLSGTSGFTDASLDAPTAIAVDASGAVWVTNCGGSCSGTANASSVTVLTPLGGSVTAQNLTGGALAGPYGLALDGNNTAWIANAKGTAVSEFTAAAGDVTGGNGLSATFLTNPTAVAIDQTGNAYVANPVSNAVVEYTSTGAAGTAGYQGSGVKYPFAIAVDHSNRPWMVNQSGNSLTALSAGVPVTGSPFTGGGLSLPNALAIDGVGAVWVSNGNGTVSVFSNAGIALSPSTGLKPGSAFASDVAVDGAGSVWVTSCGAYCTGTGSDPGAVYQMVGAATPVVTPLALGVKNGTLASLP